MLWELSLPDDQSLVRAIGVPQPLLCHRTGERCPDIQSGANNISMAVKEAVHNVIKHANASELVVRIEFASSVLKISLKDTGVDSSGPLNEAATVSTI